MSSFAAVRLEQVEHECIVIIDPQPMIHFRALQHYDNFAALRAERAELNPFPGSI
jgi:hypothetical protein